MRGADRLQKILYLIMAMLGIYIIYKSGSILLTPPGQQNVLESGKLQRGLEDQAMRTWAPGYTAAMEDHENDSWAAGWMSQAVPVYSYLAGEQEESETSESTTESAAESATENVTESTAESTAENATESAADKPLPAQGGAEKAGPADLKQETAKQKEAKEETASGEETAKETAAEEETADRLPAAAPVLYQRLQDFDYLISNYYTVDSGTVADASLLDVEKLLGEDLTLRKDPSVPQILIYHTHSQETFADSREGKTEDTIVGMGEVLAGILRDTYGYNVIHDTGVYDLVNGVLDRSASYDYAREAVQQILQENPTIEVIIDLHRDGVEGQKFVTEIDGKPTSMIMFFNGISTDSQDRPITYLQNPYTSQNLAFSLQLELAAREKYPGFTRNIYLKAERFNLHLRPRSLLVEAGTQLNTVEEEKNAMAPLADLLNQVLSSCG